MLFLWNQLLNDTVYTLTYCLQQWLNRPFDSGHVDKKLHVIAGAFNNMHQVLFNLAWQSFLASQQVQEQHLDSLTQLFLTSRLLVFNMK